MSNAVKLIEIRNNIQDIKKDFEWLLNSAAENGKYIMLKSIKFRLRSTAGIIEEIVKDLDKKESDKT